MPQVIIRNPQSDAEYEISTADFRRGKHYQAGPGVERQTYADAGFRIVSMANGQPYTGPIDALDESAPVPASDAGG